MSLTLVSDHLLSANRLQHEHLFSLLEQMSARRLDYADLYFQSSYHEAWVIEDGIIKEGSYNIDQGVGVRAIRGEKTGFAYADQITLAALNQSVMAARSIVSEAGNGRVQTLGAVVYRPLYPPLDPLSSLPREEKIALLHPVDKAARAADARVQEVTASLSGVYEQILVAATDGTLVADVRPLVRLSISVQVEQDGKRERGASGSRFGYDFFLEDVDGEVRADSWAREAVGHGLDGDFNRRGSSVSSGQMGKLVVSELCTVVDDGTLAGLRGSLEIDDEGVPGQYNVLIENGRLKGYMQDKLNARLMGVAPTRQRPARVLCALADAAYDQYLHAGRSIDAGGDYRQRGAGHLRAQLWRWTGRYYLRQVRFLYLGSLFD
ncbi:protease TldD [Sodalis glossinidius str. 'morsitans']|uniref:Modulator of DNA gyrase TldD n=1 Tax=Sodalis glossinidius (strain morsitans) TaxID=343509 RepID=Q2NWN9_SODGM|nr:putative modulator of DNA gyrase TldD [Sodalis glossinidius str. 'morsitans']CRL43790.1 protease TldD [Sodalis glossinidius str. 'morsitans']